MSLISQLLLQDSIEIHWRANGIFTAKKIMLFQLKKISLVTLK